MNKILKIVLEDASTVYIHSSIITKIISKSHYDTSIHVFHGEYYEVYAVAEELLTRIYSNDDFEIIDIKEMFPPPSFGAWNAKAIVE